MSEPNGNPSTPMNNPVNSQNTPVNVPNPNIGAPSPQPSPNSNPNPNTAAPAFPISSGNKPKKIDPVQEVIDKIGVGISSKIPDPATIVGAVEAGSQGNLQPIGAIGSPIVSTGLSVGGDAAASAIGEAIGGPFGMLIANIVERAGGKLVHGFELQKTASTFNAHIADIAIDMQAQGWVLGKHDLREISRDAQFRLWRKIFHFSGGGHFADLMRDSQENKVFALVEPQFSQFDVPNPTGTLNLADLVIAVAKATIEVTY